LGEIFFVDQKGTLPMRRLVRGIARVYRGEKSEMDAPRLIHPASGSGDNQVAKES
jgi:hypothetical protein